MAKIAKRTFRILHSAFCIAAAATAAAETLLDTDADFAFSLDTLGSPRVIGSVASAQVLRYGAGQTVTIAAPGGTVATPISSAVSAGAYAWTPDAPGRWALSNDGEGGVVFDVRYSLFPASVGAGTETDPVKAVDSDDLAALVAGGSLADGGYFTPVGSSPIDAFAQPCGHAFVDAGNGLWRLVASADGLMFGTFSTLVLDTVLPGPDRKMHRRETMPLAYAGDFWTCTNAATVATLSIAHAIDGRPDQSLAGWGAIPFTANRSGLYTVILDDGLTSLTSHINVPDDGTVFSLR